MHNGPLVCLSMCTEVYAVVHLNRFDATITGFCSVFGVPVENNS